MEIAVVLATYNGEKYIIAQLDSILTQSLQPDSVMIIDDCSTDKTVLLIEEYIKKNCLDNWKLVKHPENKGYISTFWEALRMVDSHYVFLCDQDDIWESWKIRNMYNAIKDNSACLVLCSDFEVLNEDGGQQVSLLPVPHDKDAGKTVRFDMLKNILIGPLRPGCTYCVNNNLLRYYDKYFIPEEAHDAFLYRLALLSDGLFLFPEKTIKWRRHSSNASNRTISFSKLIENRFVDIQIRRRNYLFYKDEIGQNEIIEERLKECVGFSVVRANYYKALSLINWLKMIFVLTNRNDFISMLTDIRWLIRKWGGVL